MAKFLSQGILKLDYTVYTFAMYAFLLKRLFLILFFQLNEKSDLRVNEP
jgi:hypothetical protein